MFTSEELELAQELKSRGLEWTPVPGHYVLDQSDLIECESPFQSRIFFILDLKHFLRRSGTIEALKEKVCWLPTWEQTREILRGLSVTDQSIANHLYETKAIEAGTERLELYRLIQEHMSAMD